MITRWPVPAAVSSAIPAVLVKLGPLDAGRVADLHLYFDSVPDPRARRGRWHSLTAVLLVCACRSSWERGASTNSPSGASVLRTHSAVIIHSRLLRWRRAPSPATIGRVWGLLTVTPWTGRWAPTWPTGTAPPPSPPKRRRRCRPCPGGRAQDSIRASARPSTR